MELTKQADDLLRLFFGFYVGCSEVEIKPSDVDWDYEDFIKDKDNQKLIQKAVDSGFLK